MTGPCLQDLMQQLELNYEEISRALAGTSVGFLFGSVVGGVLFSLFYKHADLLTFLPSISCTVGKFHRKELALPCCELLLLVNLNMFVFALNAITAVVEPEGACDSTPPLYSEHPRL